MTTDRLKLSRKLQAAGFPAQQAEPLAETFGEAGSLGAVEGWRRKKT
jgi:hypothetical protein